MCNYHGDHHFLLFKLIISLWDGGISDVFKATNPLLWRELKTVSDSGSRHCAFMKMRPLGKKFCVSLRKLKSDFPEHFFLVNEMYLINSELVSEL